jgi:hypothetical protein
VRGKRRLAAGSAGLLLAGALVAISSGVANAQLPIVEQSLPLMNLGSGKCLAVAPNGGDYSGNGLRVQQQTCNGADYQTWTVVWGGFVGGIGTYQIVNQKSRKCLDLTDGNRADGTPVQQWTCTASTTMLWRMAGLYLDNQFTVQNARTGSCLDVAWGSHDDGAALQGFHCTSENESQVFTQTAQPIRYTLQNQNSGYCAVLSSGDNYVQSGCVTLMNSRFELESTGDGSYRLVLATVGAVDVTHPIVNHCLEARSSSLRARVGRALCNDDLRQRWWLNWVGDGSFEVVNRRSGLCLDVLGGSVDPGAQMIQYTCNGAPNEHWYFMNW